MSQTTIEPVYKLFIQDLTKLELKDESWNLNIGNETCLKVQQFQLQGVICKVTGLQDEILIVSDSTGKAKVSRGPKVPGDFLWLKAGVHCCIIGTLKESGKLPHIGAVKLAKIENEIIIKMWDYEVKELKLFLNKTITPRII